MKIRKSKISNERGITLLTILLIFTIISVLGLSILSLSINNVKMSSVDSIYQSSYYIAESGVTYTLDRIQNEILHIYNNSNNEVGYFQNVDSLIANINNEPPINLFEESFGYTPEFKIKIEAIMGDNAGYKDYLIVSTGTIDKQSRTVEKPIRIKWLSKNTYELPDTAIFVDGNMTFSGNTDIVGNIGTNSTIPKSIKLTGNADIDGNIYVGPGLKQVLDDQMIELERIMNFYRFSLHKGEKAVSQIVLLGDFPRLDRMKQTIENQLSVPVQLFEASLPNNDLQIPRGFIPALGLALKGEVK